MDRMFEGFPFFDRLSPTAGMEGFTPIDILKQDGKLLVRADLPGPIRRGSSFRCDTSGRAAGTQPGMEIASVGSIPMGMTKAEVSHLIVVQPAQARLKPAEMHPI